MDKVFVKKHDELRLLLTEVLPYETPMIFSNYGLYKYLKKNDKKEKSTIKRFIDRKNVSTKPYEYSISKSNGDYRCMSIGHPLNQVEISKLFFDNADLLISLCSRSNFTIRTPSAVASYFIKKDFFHKETNSYIDMEVDGDIGFGEDGNDESLYVSSFFSYRGYTLIHKFFSSLQHQSLEKRYSQHLHFDISKCFDSIYTHSFSWAVKGKSYSKSNKGKDSFDSNLDKAIRNANDAETNGIIVGPEFSRVFAEVILQKIDSEVENILINRGVLCGRDYEVKRYVDDYFVYAKNRDIVDLIYGEFKKSLSKYKLYVNESKEFYSSRPFISDLTIAKYEIKDKLNDFFKSIRFDKPSGLNLIDRVALPSIQNIFKPYTRSNNLIGQYKAIVKRNDVQCKGLSGMIFSIFRSRLSFINLEIDKIKDINKYSKNYKNLIVLYLDFLFYVYAMDVRVRTSFLLSQVLVVTKEIVLKLDKISQSEINKKIRDESRVVVDIIGENVRPRLETVNVIISLRTLFGEAAISEEMLLDYFSPNLSSKIDYFDKISLLYLCCNKNDNTELQELVYESFYRDLKNSKDPHDDSELFMTFLDLSSFPKANINYIKNYARLFLKSLNKTEPKTQSIDMLVNEVKAQKRWFVDWHGELNIRNILQRKEMQSSYD